MQRTQLESYLLLIFQGSSIRKELLEISKNSYEICQKIVNSSQRKEVEKAVKFYKQFIMFSRELSIEEVAEMNLVIKINLHSYPICVISNLMEILAWSFFIA